jgi:hypothetical protein
VHQARTVVATGLTALTAVEDIAPLHSADYWHRWYGRRILVRRNRKVEDRELVGSFVSNPDLRSESAPESHHALVIKSPVMDSPLGLAEHQTGYLRFESPPLRRGSTQHVL